MVVTIASTQKSVIQSMVSQPTSSDILWRRAKNALRSIFVAIHEDIIIANATIHWSGTR